MLSKFIFFVNRFRQAFCKHEFKYEENTQSVPLIIEGQIQFDKSGKVLGTMGETKVSATCKKCGFHDAYLKFVK